MKDIENKTIQTMEMGMFGRSSYLLTTEILVHLSTQSCMKFTRQIQFVFKNI